MFKAATSAASDASLSGEDTVLSGVSFKGRKWQMLGTRTTEFKDGNKNARIAFLSAVSREFGGFSRIPESVRKVLQLNDFKMSGEKVTSQRPLTARRIKLVCEAVNVYKESHSEDSVEQLLVANVPGYEKLPKDLREAYREEIQNQYSCKDVVEQAKELPVAKFIMDRIDDQGSRRDIHNAGMSQDDTKKVDAFIGRFGSKKLVWDDPKTTQLALELMDFIALLRNEKCKPKSIFFKPVLDATKNWPAKHRAAAFQHVVQKFYSNAVSTLNAKIKDVLHETTDAQGLNYSIEELNKKIDVAALCAEIKTDTNAEVEFDYAHEFMREYVEQYKDEFSRASGRHVEAFKGEQLANKYENITEGLRIIKDLHDNDYIRKELNDIAEEIQKHGDAYHEAIETYNQEVQEFEERKNQALERGETFTQVLKARPFACAMTRIGRMASDTISRITGVDSHGKTYTPSVMVNAFDMFESVVDDFYKALDLDRQRGNDNMFGKMMDALNVRACLPARVSDFTAIREELETGKVSVEFSRKFDAMQGIGAAIQMLRDGSADAEVDYEAMVDKYVELMMQRTQDDKNPAQVKWVPGTTKLGVGIPDLQLTKDSQVTITREFLMKPEVSRMLHDVLFGCFKE